MSREGGDCVLSVKDTGQGISAEEMPRIFDRFYRSENARKASPAGTGWGCPSRASSWWPTAAR
jgi:signal transduction histidine kinase